MSTEEVARILCDSGLRATLAAMRKIGDGIPGDMVAVLVAVARGGRQERDRRAAAKALLDYSLASAKVAMDAQRLDMERARAGAPDDVHPEQRHVHMVIPPDPVHCGRDGCGWRGHRREAPDGVCPDDGGELLDG